MSIGFIFDVDGVLTDTNEMQFNSWRYIARLLEVPFKPDYENTLRGLPRDKCLDTLLNGETISYKEYENCLRVKDAHYMEQVKMLTPADLLPGIAEFLASAHAMGIAMGVASSSRRANEVCDRLGIRHYFRVIGDGACVTNHKPAPDIYLWAADQLGVSPANSVVFEDATVGVRGALTGGFWVVGLGDKSLVAEAHRFYPTLAGIAPSDCIPPFTS